MFQSSPGLVTGRYPYGNSWGFGKFGFQSSPGLVTGRYTAAHSTPAH